MGWKILSREGGRALNFVFCLFCLCKESWINFLCTTVVQRNILLLSLHNGKASIMFIGRSHEELSIRNQLADKSKAKLIIVYGRRRVGKSRLIKESLRHEKQVLFFEGLEGKDQKEQIDQFLTDLARQTKRIKLDAKNWRQVFQGLGETISQGPWVVVFDELPWMACGRSHLISDLKLFWDRWADNKELSLILCGSVASFMTKHLVHSKALHNRKTLELCVQPLKPKEAGQFIKNRSLSEKAQAYMCLGGIPKYLEQLNPKISLEKNINLLCFTQGGFFVEEYETLFKEQFRSIKSYQKLVEALARGPKNISQLSQETKIAKGGGLKEQLDNLIQAQFIRAYSPYSDGQRKKTRTKIYRLTDPFLSFYLRYLHPNLPIIKQNKRENLFRALTRDSIHQYYGLAFERLGEDAFEEIRHRLKIDLADIVNMGPYFQQSSVRGPGLQIDLLIRRRDRVWTVLEYKYSQKPIGSWVIKEMEEKIKRLRVPEFISVEKVLVSAYGVSSRVKKEGYFEAILTLADLL